MVRVGPIKGGKSTVEMFSEVPIIYLDHWALRKISERPDWRNRFLAAFQMRGTLLFSVVHLAELAGNKGESVAAIRSFLEAIGPHWMVTSVDPFKVSTLEAAWKPGDKAPYVGDFFFKQGDFLKRLCNGPVSLAHLVDMLTEKDIEAITTDLPKSCATMAQSITQFRKAYKKDPAILNKTFPAQQFNARYPMRFVVCGLMRSFVTDRFRINDAHIRDFFHTAVPLAHSHIVLLDKHWYAQAAKLKLSQQFVRIYKEANIGAFFDFLDSMPAVRN